MVTIALLEVSYIGRASERKNSNSLAPPLSSVEFQVGTVNDQYIDHRSNLSTDSTKEYLRFSVSFESFDYQF